MCWQCSFISNKPAHTQVNKQSHSHTLSITLASTHMHDTHTQIHILFSFSFPSFSLSLSLSLIYISIINPELSLSISISVFLSWLFSSKTISQKLWTESTHTYHLLYGCFSDSFTFFRNVVHYMCVLSAHITARWFDIFVALVVHNWQRFLQDKVS